MVLEVVLAPSLRERTTLKLGGTAMAEIKVGAEADLEGLGRELARLGGEPLVLGEGSNLLAEEGSLPVVLIRAAFMDAPEVVGRDGDKALVRVGAGVRWPSLLGWLARQGLSGLEAMTGIPGSVGGAVAMNAGSYGTDVDSRLARVRVFAPGVGARWLERGQWQAGYRHFTPELGQDVAGPWLVLGAELLLEVSRPEAVRQRMSGHLRTKRATQPLAAASAGCVFKNPAGQSAGRLLDQAGFKGKRLGGMAFSSLHANFLVNEGRGRSPEAFDLIGVARQAVRERFGVQLELEVKVCPCRSSM